GPLKVPPARSSEAAQPLVRTLVEGEAAVGRTRSTRYPRSLKSVTPLSRSVLTPRRVVGVSAQDAALSITFWALLHSVPTSLAITIAAAAAMTPITASAMPYSARSWPASSTISFFISAVMRPPFQGRPRVRCHGSRGVPARSDPDASHPAPSPPAQNYAADKAGVKKIVCFGIIAATPRAPVTAALVGAEAPWTFGLAAEGRRAGSR